MTRLSMTASEQAEGAGGPRILLVDDEPRIRDFISRALETAGYAVDAACSGTEGLRQAVAGPNRVRWRAAKKRGGDWCLCQSVS